MEKGERGCWGGVGIGLAGFRSWFEGCRCRREEGRRWVIRIMIMFWINLPGIRGHRCARNIDSSARTYWRIREGCTAED